MTSDARWWLRFGLRLVVLAAVIVVAVHISDRLAMRFEDQLTPENEAMLRKIVALALISYVVLMAIPFVPGVEIGLGLMTALGAAIAPLVYVATVLALSLAFLVGRIVPVAVTCRTLRRIGLRRVAASIARLELASRHNALPDFLAEKDGTLSRLLLRHRYVALAVALNIPGNAAIGGGGGLAFAEGISRAFHPAAFLITVAIAVAPVPVLVILTAST